ncbi:MAG: phosphoribosylformylglycinamidine synthase I [Proteobacteria bacterium]|nr:phosphoribosylformylglycinamidine synthase I [Pseudomonadota bacterium]
MKVRAALLYTEGTNCNLETENAFKSVGVETETLILNQIIKNGENFDKYHIIAIPGGFSYGDDISAGKVFADFLMHYKREEISRFISQGKLIIGICNGFQVLVKTGLLPDTSGTIKIESTLTLNDSGVFIDKWVNLKVNGNSVSKFIDKEFPDTIELPIAHAEGKFIASHEVLDKMVSNNQIVFQYASRDGVVDDKFNPNGSIMNIAGICDKTGQILGLMPHPERFSSAYYHPAWKRLGLTGEGTGLLIFKNAVNYIKNSII